MLIRQGDVLLRSIKKVPAGERNPIDRIGDKLILAEGEATGHCHAIRTPNVSLFEIAGQMYLSVDGETALLEHDEHAPIKLPGGDYEVVRQHYYTPAEIKRVAD